MVRSERDAWFSNLLALQVLDLIANDVFQRTWMNVSSKANTNTRARVHQHSWHQWQEVRRFFKSAIVVLNHRNNFDVAVHHIFGESACLNGCVTSSTTSINFQTSAERSKAFKQWNVVAVDFSQSIDDVCGFSVRVKTHSLTSKRCTLTLHTISRCP
ncbi:hypothetical protein D3C87_1592810 [compost metagenome]